jgi:transaldolase
MRASATMNHLESLARHTVLVADTGDLDAIATHRPQDATTNPSLILKAARDPRFEPIVTGALDRAHGTEDALDRLFVGFGDAILGLVPGRVSTEVDARLSFDRAATVEKARRLIALYEDAGHDRERVLIKVAATWEGIRAAAELEREGIHCNLTLLFSFAQAVACAEAGVTLISPFVGRIYDYFRAARGADIPIEEDPGTASVRRIYRYYKQHGYRTQVMGASFRKADQVEELCGCDLLTISPDLLDELRARDGEIARRLDPNDPSEDPMRAPLDEASYRWAHNEDAMAVEKLSDGIRRFDADARTLEALVRARLESQDR